MAKELAPIIKKIKKAGHGHHGGAWKVAYADFVTAMMAFFLLLWLLSSVPSKNLQGVADFFTPTIGLKDQQGIGSMGGASPVEEGAKRGEWTNNAIVYGAPPSGPVVKMTATTLQIKETVEAKNFTQLEHDLYKAIHENPELQQFKENILIEQTPEGLRIQIMDSANRPMFEASNAKLLPHMKKILSYLAELIRYMPNYISISGHTNSYRYDPKASYGPWELSADRANSARLFLIQSNLDPEQVTKIVARADQEPIDPKKPDEARNMRISIILLRDAVLPDQKQSVPEALVQ
jgi:chemotaxis protein MotB